MPFTKNLRLFFYLYAVFSLFDVIYLYFRWTNTYSEVFILTQFLLRRFIKNYKNTADPSVRVAYGFLSSITGISCNVLLSILKLIVGMLSGSVAVTADAFNNLSDAGSSVVTLIGFHLASRPADPDHPFGHGRFEYLASLVIAAIIMFVGGSFLKTSIEKIIFPESIVPSLIAVIVLVCSILVKLWLWKFYGKLGTTIDSTPMKAAAQDSLNDVFVTASALISIAIVAIWDISIDGWIGLGVALFILRSAWDIAKDTVDLLLGSPADANLVNEITSRIMNHECVYSIHDIIVHNYGPGRIMASVHVEVPDTYDFLKAHDAIDLIEREILEQMHIPLVIHLDPVDLHSEVTAALRTDIIGYVHDISPRLSLHDFRIVKGDSHTNLIFDITVPRDLTLEDKEIKALLDKRLADEKTGVYYTVITFDRHYL